VILCDIPILLPICLIVMSLDGGFGSGTFMPMDVGVSVMRIGLWSDSVWLGLIRFVAVSCDPSVTVCRMLVTVVLSLSLLLLKLRSRRDGMCLLA